MKKVYIVQDELDYDGGGRPQFVFSEKEYADKWCERLSKENDYGMVYEVEEYPVDEITDLNIGFYRVYISAGYIIDTCDNCLAEYKKEMDIDETIQKCVGDNRIVIGIVAYSPEEAKEKAIKKYKEVEASGFFEQYDALHYNLYLNRGGEAK